MRNYKMRTVREAGEADAADIAALESIIFPDPWTENGIRETVRSGRAAVTGAWSGRELIGYAILYTVLDEGEIARIAVASSYRRQGVAGLLFGQVLKICGDRGIVRLMLEVKESNVSAVSFYEKCGFTMDGVRKGYYSNPREDAILMSLHVPEGRVL